MYKIYFGKRCITVCHPYEQALTDPNAVQFCPGDDTGLGTLVEMFRTSDCLGRIYVPTDDVEGTFRKICGEFINVNAAGGLVANRRGDYLLIRRYGLWDLPKGHQEPGEEIRTTAIREVYEETGIKTLELQDLICITHHCYLRHDGWCIKHTWWFNMLHTDPTDLTPQREEDISKAAWVAKSSLPPFLMETYPSIVEVFKEAKI